MEDSQALILFQTMTNNSKDQRLNVPRKLLPPKAKEGSWLQFDIVGDQPSNITLDDQETETVRQRIAEKLARLRCGDNR
jgi:hypothetical protein